MSPKYIRHFNFKRRHLKYKNMGSDLEKMGPSDHSEQQSTADKKKNNTWKDIISGIVNPISKTFQQITSTKNRKQELKSNIATLDAELNDKGTKLTKKVREEKEQEKKLCRNKLCELKESYSKLLANYNYIGNKKNAEGVVEDIAATHGHKGNEAKKDYENGIALWKTKKDQFDTVVAANKNKESRNEFEDSKKLAVAKQEELDKNPSTNDPQSSKLDLLANASDKPKNSVEQTVAKGDVENPGNTVEVQVAEQGEAIEKKGGEGTNVA